MRPGVSKLLAFPAAFGILLAFHIPFLRLPYFWDEAGYYIPAALDFYRHARLIPRLTLPTGHTPLVSVYLGIVWHIAGFSPAVTRVAMLVIAAATVITTYALGREVRGREAGVWAAALLALSPLFFAQSSLVFLDLTAALFTTLAILFTLRRRWGWVALTASLAPLSKETAIIAMPVIWAFMWLRGRERRWASWAFSAIPVAVLAAWAIYYHGQTGFWTGNSQYLQYNLYSALTPLHIARSLVARVAEILAQGFNWVVVAGAAAGIWYARRKRGTPREGPESCFEDFLFIASSLIGVYIVALSLVGGAVLPRYMLPAFPAFYVLAVCLISGLPKFLPRALCVLALACFISSWFINPPYPFPYEDNLAYATFIRLHQEAAKFLEALPGKPVILTAWPATDELKQPFLGYVERPLRVAQTEDFTPAAFTDPPRFDVLYLYSRKWEPADNWLTTLGPLRAISRHFYDYVPAEEPATLARRFRLRLLTEFQARGQWVRIYSVARRGE